MHDDLNRPNQVCKQCRMTSHPSIPRVVVAVDFGTTFSGFAYARTSQPSEIFKFFDWPCANKVGAKPYCKTQTSIFYTPSAAEDGSFVLKEWGWSALNEFTQASQAFKSQARHRYMHAFGPRSPCHDSYDSGAADPDHDVNVLAFPQELAAKVGFFATKFKLYLAPEESTGKRSQLPENLTVERMVSDYLRCLSVFIISKLQDSYGKHFSMTDVQWCLTVPAIWDESAKQIMRNCAEDAGMVKGGDSPRLEAVSPYPLSIILEPEAASVYCQERAKLLGLREGDKLLVADVGGGTIDLVVHAKADNDPESMRVHEVVASYGDVGGGTFVDSHFFHFLSKKIGCFKDFCQKNTSAGINIYGWWQGAKMAFDGNGCSIMQLPRKLSAAWEEYDQRHGITQHSDDYYDELRVEEDEMRSIFDPEVNKVLSLIEKEIEGIRVLMVVGGFAASPYLTKCIRCKFMGRVEEIIIPVDPGSAICHGAVQMQLRNDTIQSRIAKRTYGVGASRTAMLGDPPKLLYVDDAGEFMCRNVFTIFVKAGDRVPLNASIQRSYWPGSPKQRGMTVHLYSSSKTQPEFTTEAEVVKEGSFEVDIMEGLSLGEEREVEVSMCFGASLIQVTATRVNFGNGNAERGLSVKFLKD